MKKGIPPAAAIAFLIATPELGLDAIVISIPLLGVEMTVARLIAATAVALCAGIVAGGLVRGEPARPVPEGCVSSLGEVAPKDSAAKRAINYGLVESVDDLGPWILAGILMAGMLEPMLSEDLIASLPAHADVPLMAAAASPLYVCASAATPVAAVFMIKGISAGAVIAFLLTGPATNVTTYGAVRTAHGRRTTFLLLATILLASVAAGFAVNAVGPSVASPALTGEHDHEGLIGLISAGVFGGLLLLSFLRQGPRGFLSRLGLAHEHEERGPHGHRLRKDGHDGHDHGNGHDGHDHGDGGHEHGAQASAPSEGGCCDSEPVAPPPGDDCCG
jgi:hypothetical protein